MNKKKLQNKVKEEFPLGLDFFSMFVHELKTPLVSLKFQMDHLKMCQGKKNFDEVISSMEKDMSLLLRFIHDSLEMKEIEDQKIIKSGWTDFESILNQAKNHLEQWIFNAEVTIETPLTIQNIEIKADPRWIQTAISNLLINAIQHSPRKGVIQIQVQFKKNQSLLVSITDEGPGIHGQFKDKLFHRFQSHRKHETSPSLIKGTGLGLFIAKSIIEAHGGSIGCSNGNKKGASFYFVIPKARFLKAQRKVS